MARFKSPLNDIKIASPCSAKWEEMIGNERRRFCGQCKMNVFNLSAMSRTEAERLIINAEGRLCARFYRRADGTILTKNCPVGWRAAKQRVSRLVTAFVSLVFTFIAGIGFASFFNRQPAPSVMGEILREPVRHDPDYDGMTMGTVVMDEPMIMGEVAPLDSNANFEMGKPAISAE